MKKYWPLFLISIITFFSFVYKLGRDLLWDWDECLYGQYAVEMVQKNHYLTNIWNGYIDLQKPPLYSWILALVGGGTGSEFVLRMVSVVGALALLISVYIFAQKSFSRRTAILTSLVLLTGEIYVIYSMKLSTDILYSLFIFLAFWTWWNAKDKKSKWSGVLTGILFGIAVMVKGLGSLQFIAALGAATLLFPSNTRFINFVKMGVTFAAVIIPWHAVAYFTYGDRFIKVYIFDNILKRSKYPIEFHRERIWFYIVLLYRELKPWLFAGFILPIILIAQYLKMKRNGKWFKTVHKELKKKELIVTILIMFALPLLSITRVQTRIAWYALPLYPFIALYIGYNLNLIIEFCEKKNRKLGFIIFTLLIILLSLDALRLFNSEVKPTKERTIDPRYEVILAAQKQPDKELNYLVAFGERQAKEILPPTEQIDMTFVYGGNPCAVYYSEKDVNYFYDLKEFEHVLKTKKGLFLIQNGDLNYAENKKKIFNNNDYTLFRQ